MATTCCSQKLKLIYFDTKGRAEVTRQMFVLAGIEFEDVRLTAESWKELKDKDTVPFGQLPILVICKDNQICQSGAIEYYVAKTYGFYGSNLLEETKCFMYTNCLIDMATPLFELFKIKDDKEASAKLVKEYIADKFPTSMARFDKFVANNTSNYLVGSKISVPDLRMIIFYEYLDAFGVKYDLSSYPNLVKHKETITGNTVLKEYLAKRKETKF